ncbi:MAG: 23S rRNA (adenine(2503)-C(2))-methyltransferase RlmN [Armatimonadota bacterium]
MELPVVEQAGGPAAGPPLVGRTRAELEALAVELGQPAYRGRQVARWLYARGVRSVEEMTDLPAAFRARLAEAAPVGRSEIVRRQASRDGTVKVLLRYPDEREIETVVLPYPDRVSVCISSQVGCPVGCVFCATATMGFGRNLTPGELLDQVLTAREEAPGGRLTHVVVMGMGEPLLNYESLVKALRLMHEEVGLSYRHLTVSTSGHVPGIRRLAEEGLPVTLALSLHAPNDPLRAELIPLSRKWGIDDVMGAVRDYQERTGRRVTLEYLLLARVNDEPEHAEQLARLCRGMITHVNLIPWNPADTFTRFEAPSGARVRAFRSILEGHGVTVTQRVERGQDIAAACGQLAVKARREGGEEIAVAPRTFEDVSPALAESP